jgi:hypothetical protein
MICDPRGPITLLKHHINFKSQKKQVGQSSTLLLSLEPYMCICVAYMCSLYIALRTDRLEPEIAFIPDVIASVSKSTEDGSKNLEE